MTGELRWHGLCVSPKLTERVMAVHGTVARTARRKEGRAPVRGHSPSPLPEPGGPRLLGRRALRRTCGDIAYVPPTKGGKSPRNVSFSSRDGCVRSLVVVTTGSPVGGGPRSERARRAILSAAADLLDEVGFASMTIEGVAARAGAGKATVYRRWSTKGALAMDALMAEIDPAAPFPDTGSAIEDFRLQLGAVARVFNRPRLRNMLTGIVLEGQTDPELRSAFAHRYMNPRRDQARAVIARGIARGELRADFNEEVLFDQLYGAVYFRLLVSGRPLNRRFAGELVDQAFRGLRPPPRPH